MELTLLLRPQGHNQAVLDGDSLPPHLEFRHVDEPVLVHGFRKMVRQLSYDVAEMAITTYVCAKANGVAMTALPIFLSRGLHHGAILGPRSRSTDPQQLSGGTVGVNRGYTVTTGVWARAALADEFNVDLNTITWVRSDDEHVAEYTPPSNVKDLEPPATLIDLLLEGKLDAIVGAMDHRSLAPIIPDYEDRAIESLKRTGVYPINHLLVVRDEVLESSPGLAQDLCEAFLRAKTQYLNTLTQGHLTEPSDIFYRKMGDIVGDPLPYGIEANRRSLEMLLHHALIQRIVDHPTPIEDLFHPDTLGFDG